MESKIKLAIVDDDTLYKSVLSSFIKTYKDITVILEASDGMELTSSLKKNKIPDIILLDLEMPGMDGIKTTEFLSKEYPNIRILILTMNIQDELFNYLITMGVNGFLLKDSGFHSIIEAIHSVKNTGYYFSNIDLKKIILSTNKGNIKSFSLAKVLLSEREIEIVQLICKQYTNKEISKQLCISARTVDGHRNKLLQKVDVRNTAGLVIFALQNNLISINQML